MLKRILLTMGALAWLTGTPAMSQTANDLKNDGATPNDILTYGMGQGQTRYSSLKQINKDTVKKLVPVWSYSLNDSRGQETFPLLHDGMMYVTTHASTIALNPATGAQIWKTAVEYPAETPRVACCGIVNRGAAIYEGKIFRTTLDANVVALDAKTGKEIWRTKSIEFRDGYSMTVAPLVANGVVIVGISGGEFGIRGYIEGYDPNTGKQLWRTYTVPAPGEAGSDSWPDGDQWKRGGGPTWLTGSYDPELDLVYWGTGNAASWNSALRLGDNLYTASMLAVDPKTGTIKWHYQFTPNDAFDYDSVNEPVLTELDGKKVLMQANRNGFFYVIDRTNGKLIAANKYIEDVNWADSIDLTTGRPVETQLAKDLRSGKEIQLQPSALGGKNWSHMSYDSERSSVFINTLGFGMNIKQVESQYRAGTFYWGAEFSFAWPEGDRGALRAVDPMTGKSKWKKDIAIPRFASIMSTAGGLVFTGAQTGEFEAFDSDTGDKLWQFQTGSGIVGQPVTWELDGKQYVTIANGSGGVYVLFGGDERLASVPAGGGIWTFALSE